MTIEFGIFDHLDSNGRPLGEQYEDRLYLAEVYERLGYRAYHVAEHHLSLQGRAPSPSVFLSALAQRTHTMRLGPMVYTLCFHHPLRLLEEICMLDHLSAGRLELGVGRGVSPIELSLYGVDVGRADALYEEALSVVLQGLSTKRIDVSGQHYRFENIALDVAPLQRPHPPLWMGVTRPESAARAAQRGANIVCLGRAAEVCRLAAVYRCAWAEQGGKAQDMPLIGLPRHLVVADSDAEALTIGRRAYAVWYANRMHLWRLHGSGPPARLTLPESFDKAIDEGFCIAGSPATVSEIAAQHIEAAGISYFLAHVAFGDISRSEALRSATLFAEAMMPDRGGGLPRPAPVVARHARL